MAVFQREQEQTPNSLLDALYCEEEKWEFEDFEEEENNPLLLSEHEMIWENDEEIKSLFAREKMGFFDDVSMINLRKESVEWILRVNLRYGFSALTTMLSVNYFDKCISCIPFIQCCKPWTVQLAAVACLSLAAKVEETHVPLLLDLQVEGASLVFEAKDVQKMELLVLSTLGWKMHPITPISFLHHFIQRLGINDNIINNNNLNWEFLRRCENILLSLLSDWRFVSYLPSVLATATMMHVIDQIGTCDSLEYRDQLLNVPFINKEKVNECYDMIVDRSPWNTKNNNNPNSKRKFHQMISNSDNDDNNYNNGIPSSPKGVMDSYYLSSDSSNDSWATTSNASHTIPVGQSISTSVSSSLVISWKRGRVYEQFMPLSLPSMSRVAVDVNGWPR